MWKAICNIGSAVADLAIIAGQEVAHQFNSASEATESFTESISIKAAEMRASYEADLAERESGVTKPEVVKSTPSDVIPVN